MPLISTSIPNLINGVSQQPDALRLPSQVEAMVNAYPSVVEGLGKRPPTEHVAKIITGALGSAYLHTINRDTAERYIVVITNGDLRVFDINGVEKTVNFPDGKTYLNASDPKTMFRAVTVADYTFIVNTSVTCAMAATKSPAQTGQGLVSVKQAVYETDYKVKIDGTERATHTTAASGALKTTTIAEDLKTDLATWGGASWTITRERSTVWIKKNDGTDFELKTEDSRANTALTPITNKVQRFTDLPTVAPTDFVVEVVGENTNNFDNYYVKFKPNNPAATFDEGVWEESVKSDIKIALDATTMPHTLVRNGDGTFTFAKATWGNRVAGDEDSAPEPSFIGTTITDVFFFKNRLGFIADENVIMSRAGEFFEFFPATVTTLLDSDPIDVAVSHTKVSILRSAVPWNEKLLLFSDQTQFVLEGGDILSPKTVSVTVSTEFEAARGARPVVAGKNVYFPVNKGGFTGIREYFLDGATLVEDAADVTAHVPKYIPSGAFKLAAATNEDIMVVLASGDQTRMFPYKYFWSGDEKLQSAWSEWSFGSNVTILNADFIDTDLYLVLQRTEGVFIEKIDVSPGRTDTANVDHLTHLDRRITNAQCTGVSYNAGTNQTTFTLPYDLRSGATYQVVSRDGAATVGVIYPVVSTGSNTVVVSGDKSAEPVYIGEKYETRVQLSTITIKEEAPGGGRAVVGDSRVQLRFITLVYDNTGYFKVKVTHRWNKENPSAYQYDFTGRILGTGQALIGSPALEDGKSKFPVLALNADATIEIINDTFLPMHILSADVEAFFVVRNQRL
jgi:hypothetical protein